MSPGPGPQYRQGPQMYAAPEQQAPAPAPSNDGPGFFEGLFRPIAMMQAFSGLNGKGGMLGKTGLGPVVGGLMGGYQLYDSIAGDGGFAERGFGADGDSYAQGAQGLLGLGGVAMANPYLAAGAATIGLGRRGESALEKTPVEGLSFGNAWDRTFGLDEDGTSRTREWASAGADVMPDWMGGVGDVVGGGVGGLAGGVASVGDVALGGLMNLGGGICGVASDIGNFLFD